MTVTNLKYHTNLTFDQYLEMPGWSYSKIKSETMPFTGSAKVSLGKQVHTYLTEPDNFTGDVYMVRSLAMTLKRATGALWPHLKHCIKMTADFCHEGFVMPYKGEIDSGIPGKLVIDYKVGENVRKTMFRFGYIEQLTGYMLASDSPAAMILAIHPKTHAVDVIPVPKNVPWWEKQVITRGYPIQ